jgi:hypothetical protein
MCTNLVAELALQLEVSALFDVVELHAFEHTVNLVLVELPLEELGDAFECLGLKFLAGGKKLFMVLLVEQHIVPLEHERIRWHWHVANRQGFGGTQHLLESTCVQTRGGHQILYKRIITSWLHVYVLSVASFFVLSILQIKREIMQ